MSEIIKIKNFGAIRNIEMILREINILIGDQGTGKSTLAKVLIAIHNTAFRELFDIAVDNLKTHDTQLFFEHLKIVGIQNYLNKNSEIYYSNSIFTFKFKNQIAIVERNKITWDGAISYDFNYIPSERSLVITLSNSLFALMQTGTALPQLFLRFGDKFQKARKDKRDSDYKNVLGITYSYREDGDFIILKTGQEIPIQDSSSGIQGTIALLTVFDYVTKTSAVDNLLVIEEPELNCFPETQYKLVKHFLEKNSNTLKNKNYKNQLLFTTHSPYILTSLNNLMYAYEVGKVHEEAANKIIDRKFWLNPQDVSAYMLLPNGTCEEILDREENLIRAEKIDGVSGFLNEQFDALLNIELVQK